MTETSPDEPPTNELIREVYARFGLAYYQSECLHRGLCIIHAISRLPSREQTTRPMVDERLAVAFTLTLGDVTRDLDGILPAPAYAALQDAVEKRNFLAHHFWFDRAHLLFSTANAQALIAELDKYAALFTKLDEQAERWYQQKHRELGLKDEDLQTALEKIIAGEAEEPLPDKDTVKRLAKQLKGRQRLTRVWECPTTDGGKSLIFELVDGSLWQLSDLGLGWTRSKQISPEWTEQPAIKPYLPADILPRPHNATPWQYEFTLARNAVLWVKPGRRPRTFNWGVRTPDDARERTPRP